MFQNKKAFLFDLDGTLVDSMWMWKAIDIEYLQKFNLELPGDLQSCIEGKSFSETAVYMKERFQIPDSIEKMMDDWNEMAYYKYSNEVPLKPHVYEFIKIAHEKGIKLGICTSNSRHLVNAAIEALHIAEYFDCIMTACEVNRGKPFPDIYLAVAKALETDPTECIVFEDIVPGIMAGKNAGMEVIAVEDAYSLQAKEEKEAIADFYITDYEQLIPYLINENE